MRSTKNYLFLFIVVIASSFKSIRNEHQPSIHQLLGLWEMCSKEIGTKKIRYLVCPEVQFNDKAKSYMISSKSYFVWHISSDTLFINITDSKKDEAIFEDSIYLMAFSQKPEHMELKLKSIHNDYTLVLGKSNK
jgi:hypothetical protein